MIWIINIKSDFDFCEVWFWVIKLITAEVNLSFWVFSLSPMLITINLISGVNLWGLMLITVKLDVKL